MTLSMDKTPIGMQYVIPGAERVVKKRRKAFQTDGDQFVLPGAERIPMREYLERLADKPMKPRRRQVGLLGTGLFGT